MPSQLVTPWLKKLKKCYGKFQNIDTGDIVISLYSHKYISENEYKNFMMLLQKAEKAEQKDAEENARIEIFRTFPNLLTFDQFLSVVFHLKYHTEALDCQIVVGRTGNTYPGFSEAQQLYLNLKQYTQNNVFKGSPVNSLQDMFDIYKQKLEVCRQTLEREVNANRRYDLQLELQEMANKCVSCIFATLDAEITRWKSPFEWNEESRPGKGNILSELFHQVKCLTNDVSNAEVVATGLYPRVAIAYAMSKQLTKADQYISKAYTASVNTPVCAELEFMLYMFVMVMMFQMEKIQSNISCELFKKVVNKSLHSLDEENDDNVRNFWRRMIMLRYVFLLLGLKNNIEILRGFNVTDGYITEAKMILAEITRMGDMEARRKMFFYAAKARIEELEETFDCAIVYVEKGIACDETTVLEKQILCVHICNVCNAKKKDRTKKITQS